MIIFLIAICLTLFLNLFSIMKLKRIDNDYDHEKVTEQINMVIRLLNQDISLEEIRKITKLKMSEVQEIISLYNKKHDIIDIIYQFSQKAQIKQAKKEQQIKIKEVFKNFLIVLCIIWILTLLKG